MFLLDVLLRPALIGLWVLFWAYWFRLGRMARLRKMIVVMTVLLAVSMAMLRLRSLAAQFRFAMNCCFRRFRFCSSCCWERCWCG